MLGHFPNGAEPGLPLYQLLTVLEGDNDISFRLGLVALVLYSNQYVAFGFNVADSGTVFQLCGLMLFVPDATTRDPGCPPLSV